MKGTLHKLKQTWMVEHCETSGDSNWITYIQLHPDDQNPYEGIIDDSINEGKVVEFEIVEVCHNYEGEHINKDCSCKEGLTQYAKLIQDNLSDWDVTLNDGLENL
jgi:hypothetical protein